MLALFLMKSKFFKGKAVTLVGYSLGTQVVMAAIKTLKHFYRDGNKQAGVILHDIQFWAGAYVSDPNKTAEERLKNAYQCNVVNGRITNFHSDKDTVIKYLFT